MSIVSDMAAAPAEVPTMAAPSSCSAKMRSSDDGLAHVARHPVRRLQVHAQPGCRVHLDDGPVLLHDGAPDVLAQQIDAGDVEVEHLRGQLGHARVARVHLVRHVRGRYRPWTGCSSGAA
jgi:hypothetical protein